MRVADRKNGVAYPNLVAVSESHRRKRHRALDLQESDVGIRVGADKIRFHERSIEGFNLNVDGIHDDMVIRHDVSVFRNDETRAGSNDGLARQISVVRIHEPAEILFERRAFRQVEPGDVGGLPFLRDVDVDDGRHEILHQIGVPLVSDCGAPQYRLSRDQCETRKHSLQSGHSVFGIQVPAKTCWHHACISLSDASERHLRIPLTNCNFGSLHSRQTA